MELLIKNALVVPMTGDDPFMGSVGVDGNRIVYVGAEVSDAERVIDAGGKVLMPGLVNTHGHVAMTLLRGYADDLPLMTWLEDHVWPFEAKMTGDDVARGTALGIEEMLLGGTTSFVDMYGFEERVAEEADRLGIRALLGAGVLDASIERYEETLRRLLVAAATDRVRAAAGPHAPYTCNPDTLKRVKELAEKYDLPLVVHLSETEDEVRMIRERYGKTSTEYLDELGLLGPRTIAAHCVHLTDGDIAILKERGVHVSHNAQSNMKLASGVARVTELLRQGVNVSLGTDGACSNNDLDMWEEMRAASYLQKVTERDPRVLPAYETLRMATVYGAKALGYNDLGFISEGALADFILVNVDTPHMQPIHNIVSNLVYSGKASDVDTVVVDGKILVEDGRLL